MWKAVLAGAFALATMSLSFSSHGIEIAPAAAQEYVVTEGQIARLHAALHLTASQQRQWYAVAAMLRRLGRAQQQYRLAGTEPGFVTRTRARVAGYTVTAMTIQRLRTAARPLIATLSEEQKNAGRNALASMGVSF